MRLPWVRSVRHRTPLREVLEWKRHIGTGPAYGCLSKATLRGARPIKQRSQAVFKSDICANRCSLGVKGIGRSGAFCGSAGPRARGGKMPLCVIEQLSSKARITLASRIVFMPMRDMHLGKASGHSLRQCRCSNVPRSHPLGKRAVG